MYSRGLLLQARRERQGISKILSNKFKLVAVFLFVFYHSCLSMKTNHMKQGCATKPPEDTNQPQKPDPKVHSKPHIYLMPYNSNQKETPPLLTPPPTQSRSQIEETFSM